jgi:UDP-N-acetylmuramoylalanine--D-glutamate ligase
MKVTVMGLGLNGGGLASARYFARHGARVTVTDLRTPELLKDSIEQLSGLPVRYVLEKHEEQDFTTADLVIKNPAVAPTSRFLEAARSHSVPIETDLSIFFSIVKNPVIGVTGSKGKSTTASAIAFGLGRVDSATVLAGNITVSPLDFVDGMSPRSPVVLELSSWQLGDLRGRGLLRPAISAFTVILPDHLDRYNGMGDYIADKKVIFQEQERDQKAVFNLDDPWQREFPRETRAQPFFYSASDLPDGLRGAWLEGEKGIVRLSAAEEKTILSGKRLPGAHNAVNLLCAGLVLGIYGVKADVARKALSEFPGVEHRLEMFRQWRQLRFYNDSAATIPQATVQAIKSVEPPVVLIMGGSDKNMDFSPFAEVARAPRALVLLAGSGTEKIRSLLDKEGVAYKGPFGDLASAVDTAITAAGGGEEPAAVLFSPGCTSFGMFRNEFDRGARFKQTVLEATSG